jgi:hypothetical protein
LRTPTKTTGSSANGEEARGIWSRCACSFAEASDLFIAYNDMTEALTWMSLQDELARSITNGGPGSAPCVAGFSACIRGQEERPAVSCSVLSLFAGSLRWRQWSILVERFRPSYQVQMPSPSTKFHSRHFLVVNADHDRGCQNTRSEVYQQLLVYYHTRACTGLMSDACHSLTFATILYTCKVQRVGSFQDKHALKLKMDFWLLGATHPHTWKKTSFKKLIFLNQRWSGIVLIYYIFLGN